MPMTPREMVKLLKKNGFVSKGQNGSHRKIHNLTTNKTTTVPMHNKDLNEKDLINMLIYPAVFTQDGNYIMVEFPDVPEALTQGETLEEAFNMAVEVLGFALEDKKEFLIHLPWKIFKHSIPMAKSLW